MITIVVLAPLPLGSNRPFPSTLLLATSGVLLIFWSTYSVLAKGAVDLRRDQLQHLAAPAVLYGLVLVWIFLQWMPLAANGMFHSWGDPLWEEASHALAMPRRPSVSINPAATLDGTMRLMAYAGLFWLTLHLARDPTRAARARAAIIIVGTAYSLYGLFALFGGEDWLLGNIAARAADSLTSSFVNRNSFATFAGLALLAAVSLFLERIRHLLVLERPLRRKLALVIEHMVFQSGLLTGAVLTIALALLLTTSRGGIFASLFALGALVLLQLPGRGGSRKRSVGFVVLIVLGVAIVAGGGNFLDRLGRQGLSFETDLRSKIFATTIDAIRTAPLTGTGYGTYGQTIEAYRANDEDIFAIWEKAHNTYLENALELGLPVAIALNLAIFLLARRAFLGVRARKRHRSFPALGVAATLLVGLHALVDFSLQIPAIAVLYAFIMGLALAQSSSSGRSLLPAET